MCKKLITVEVKHGSGAYAYDYKTDKWPQEPLEEVKKFDHLIHDPLDFLLAPRTLVRINRGDLPLTSMTDTNRFAWKATFDSLQVDNVD